MDAFSNLCLPPHGLSLSPDSFPTELLLWWLSHFLINLNISQAWWLHFCHFLPFCTSALIKILPSLQSLAQMSPFLWSLSVFSKFQTTFLSLSCCVLCWQTNLLYVLKRDSSFFLLCSSLHVAQCFAHYSIWSPFSTTFPFSNRIAILQKKKSCFIYVTKCVSKFADVILFLKETWAISP